MSVYGLSKLNGELMARMYCSRALVIRTCGLYGVWGSGGKGGNFIETMLRLANQGQSLKVVNDQHCTPTATADLAPAIAALIRAGAEGVYHLTSSGSTTWHDLAAEIFRQAGITADLSPTTSAAYGAPARRPPYSVLDCSRAGALGIRLPPWQEAVGRYLVERTRKPPA